MNNATKTILGLIVAILVVRGIYTITQKSSEPTTDEVIKIGVILPLTGPGEEYGVASKNGIELAVEQINAIGGINGRKIEVVYEDDKCNPKDGLTALNKLVSLENIKVVIGAICSGVVLGIAPEVQKDNLLVISSGASNPEISDYPNIFRNWPSDAAQGEFLTKLAQEKLGIKKAAIIYINNDYGVVLKNLFKKEFEKIGQVVAEEAIPDTMNDARTQLLKIKASNPDAIFLFTYAKQMGIILKQSQELKINKQFLGGEGTKDQTVIDVAGSGAEGLIGLTPSMILSQVRNNFFTDFQSKYNEEPGLTGDTAYDIPFLLKEAMNKCSDSDVDCLKAGLLRIKDYHGVSGIINFDANGDLVGKTYDIITVKNGEFVPYEE